MTLHFQTIRNYDDFLGLRQTWNELACQSGIDHAFMRHEWFDCWLRNMGDPSRLAILAGYQEDRLAAIAPLQINREKLKGIPVRSISFLMSGISPRCNFIIHPRFPRNDFFKALFQIRGWDLMNLGGLESEIAVTSDFISFLEREYSGRYTLEAARQSPFLHIDGNWDNYLESLSKKHRKNIKQGLNRMARLGQYVFEKCDSPGRFIEIYDDILGVSQKSWKAKSGSDIGAIPSQKAFYRDFCGSFEGLWEMRLLWVGDKCIAFNIFLRQGNRMTGIRTDYDEEYRYYGPGQMMILFTLMDLFKSRLPWEFDMGGMAADFKLDWTDHVRNHVNIMVAHPGPFGSLLLFGRIKLLPFLRRLSGKSLPPETIQAGTPPQTVDDE